MNIRYHEAARQEEHEAIHWYATQSAGLDDRFCAALAEAEDEVSADPWLPCVMEDGVRKRNLNRFPYAILYEILDNEIFVHAIMHLHREPGYWRGRKTK